MGTNKVIKKIESDQLNKYPDFSSGDTVEVSVKVKEGKRERIQLYEGVVIAKKNKGISSSFTVRKISYGEGVERVFQLHSKIITVFAEQNFIIYEKDLENQLE